MTCDDADHPDRHVAGNSSQCTYLQVRYLGSKRLPALCYGCNGHRRASLDFGQFHKIRRHIQ